MSYSFRQLLLRLSVLFFPVFSLFGNLAEIDRGLPSFFGTQVAYAQTGDDVLYGPRTLVRRRGRRGSVKRITFSANGESSGLFRFENGAGVGRARAVRRAKVYLNGELLVGCSEWRENPHPLDRRGRRGRRGRSRSRRCLNGRGPVQTLIEKEAELQPQNELRIQYFERRRSLLRLTVLRDGQADVLTADAGPDKNARVEIPISLDGSRSSLSEEALLEFSWSLTSQPDGSSAVLVRPDEVSPHFVPDVPGEYTFQLVVSDGTGTSAPDSVTVTAVPDNAAPNAVVSEDFSVVTGSVATLSGEDSSDPEQQLLDFQWSFLSVPSGSSLTNGDLLNADSAVVSFTSDVSGSYLLELEVSDGTLVDRASVSVMATTAGTSPVARAGGDRYLQGGSEVQLDGTMSFDGDGSPSPLSYQWRLLARPSGSGVTSGDIVDPTTSAPRFVPDVEGGYLFELRVDDGSERDFDNVLVVIDSTAPQVVISNPMDGAVVNTSTPTIEASFSDETALDLYSYQILVNGVDVTGTSTGGFGTLSYTPGSPLTPGDNSVLVRAVDRAGNIGTAAINFSISVFRAIADCAPTEGTPPLSVRLRSRSEFTGGSIVLFRWDFDGDGNYDTSDSVARDYDFVYREAGTFRPRLQVTNNFSETRTDECEIRVTLPEPTARAEAVPSNGPVPLTVNFTGTGEKQGGRIVRHEWDFDGDGVYDQTIDEPSPGAGLPSSTVPQTYRTEGTRTVFFRVTDNEGRTAVASASSTSIRVGPPGSPSVTATATPSSGIVPLSVQFSGTATDDGTIQLWEWDFDGDGVYDESSTTSPNTTHVYTSPGRFAARLRVTDDENLANYDIVEVVTNLSASLSVAQETFRPAGGGTGIVATTLSGDTNVRVFVKRRNGTAVRTLFQGQRAGGSYTDEWDGLDDSGSPVPQGDYYAVLEYNDGGFTETIDLTNSTGGRRYNPSRSRLPRSFRPFENDLLDIDFTIPSNRGPSEILAFVGLFRTNTRFITLLDRVALGAGAQTIYWDGLDVDGNFAVPPPGDTFLFGIWGYELPDNAFFVEAAPDISGVTIEPNLFNPSTPNYITPADPVAEVSYVLDYLAAEVELSVTNLSTGRVIRRIREANVPAGNQIIFWDGMSDSGLFADAGNYRLSLRAFDTSGGSSITRFGLVKVFH
ncbi:PKD domain-containing protein [bacterium]|nr:PKD domain-containing protein [bacterium]